MPMTDVQPISDDVLADIEAVCGLPLAPDTERVIKAEFVQSLLVRLRVAEAAPIARPLEEWHDDCGPVLWWAFPIEEAPWAGSPGDSDWPGYHTHWTPIRLPEQGA